MRGSITKGGCIASRIDRTGRIADRRSRMRLETGTQAVAHAQHTNPNAHARQEAAPEEAEAERLNAVCTTAIGPAVAPHHQSV